MASGFRSAFGRWTQNQARRGFAAKRYFRSIHSIDARFAARRAAGGNDDMARQETKFHQPSSDILGKIEAIDDARFACFELRECPG